MTVQQLIAAVLLLILPIISISGVTVISKSNVGFQPTWPSLDQRTLPKWYDRSKIGIFIHWGVYSVPAFGTEWFWTNWRTVQAPAYTAFMTDNYRPGFTYQEFANSFRGELFNATEWAAIIAASGARYVVLTSKHHDGYALWPSRYSFGWNSVDVGLHRDVIAELATAVRALPSDRSVRFGLYHSLFEWYNPMYVADREANFTTQQFVSSKIMPELKELVETYRPEVIWSDGEWEAPDTYWNSTEFLAWLYNDSPVRETVVSNDRWGQNTLCKHGDFYTCSDRFNPGTLQSHKWENAMTLDRKSWGHRTNAKLEDYLTAEQLIGELVVTVSCGGNLLVNVGPNKAGTIEPIFVERLNAMGAWLAINGEAIYDTSPWRQYQNDTNNPSVWYTMGPRRVTETSAIYAIVLQYPYEEKSVSLAAIMSVYGRIVNVNLLGYRTNLEWALSEYGELIKIKFPPKEQIDKHRLTLAWTIKFTIIGDP